MGRILLIGVSQGVMVGGRFDGWLMQQIHDGQWVSIRKLETADPFEHTPEFLRPSQSTELSAPLGAVGEAQHTPINDRELHEAEARRRKFMSGFPVYDPSPGFAPSAVPPQNSLPNLAPATPKPDLPSEARADAIEQIIAEAFWQPNPQGRTETLAEFKGRDPIGHEEYMGIAWHAARRILALESLTAPDHGDVASQGSSLPDDMVRLIIAARVAAYGDEADAKTELDKAVEAFADRVPWDDEPDDVASQGGDK